MENIHIRIKKLREDNHMKQLEVAKVLDISQQAYSYYELDKRELPTRHVVSLAKLYNVSADYILGVEPGQFGSHDLSAKFFQDITLKDVILDFQKLDNVRRQEMVKYLAYLNTLSSNG